MQLDVKSAIGSVKMAGNLHSRCALRSAESPTHPTPRHSLSFQTVLRNSTVRRAHLYEMCQEIRLDYGRITR